jgi:succinylglutamic semialdehyde dehydrogenase
VPEGHEGQAVIDAVVALSDRLIAGAWNSTPEPFMGPLISARAGRMARDAAALFEGTGDPRRGRSRASARPSSRRA